MNLRHFLYCITVYTSIYGNVLTFFNTTDMPLEVIFYGIGWQSEKHTIASCKTKEIDCPNIPESVQVSIHRTFNREIYSKQIVYIIHELPKSNQIVFSLCSKVRDQLMYDGFTVLDPL